MDDDERIAVTNLSDRMHKSRTDRKVGCGHTVKAGEPYHKSVDVVDGDFSSMTECTYCMAGWPNPETIVACEACKGSGYDDRLGDACPTCFGAGSVERQITATGNDS